MCNPNLASFFLLHRTHKNCQFVRYYFIHPTESIVSPLENIRARRSWEWANLICLCCPFHLDCHSIKQITNWICIVLTSVFTLSYPQGGGFNPGIWLWLHLEGTWIPLSFPIKGRWIQLRNNNKVVGCIKPCESRACRSVQNMHPFTKYKCSYLRFS